jgi:Golgi SNAP receptor complex protein 1
MLTREGRRRHSSTHIRSSAPHQAYQRSRQKKKYGWRPDSTKFSNKETASSGSYHDFLTPSQGTLPPRHREVLSDHRRELARLKSTLTEARNRANLLSNVRSDIDAYRSANPGQAEADYMLDERRRLDNSHNVADSVLSQAYAVQENFSVQRDTLANINRRIVGAASQVPGINSLIGRIGTKKRRDGIILGAFIAFCFLMLLWFR